MKKQLPICIKCNKQTKVKDTFVQWYTSHNIDDNMTEHTICKRCIKKHKIYEIETCYSQEADITFIFAKTRIPMPSNSYIELGQTLIGYHYGHDDESNKQIKVKVLKIWLKGNNKARRELLRESFNENGKYTNEVLY